MSPCAGAKGFSGTRCMSEDANSIPEDIPKPEDSADLAITVGATGTNDRRASFSNYGDTVDIFAPGVDVMAASANSNGYVSYSGTSMVR